MVSGPGSVEYLALEVVKGRVCLSYDLGSGAVRLQTERQVADGRFHSITVRRIGNVSPKGMRVAGPHTGTHVNSTCSHKQIWYMQT